MAIKNSFLGSLNHIKDLSLYKTERPYEIWLDQEDYYPEDRPKTNIQLQLHHDIPIHDVRDVGVNHFSAEKQGFQFIPHPMPEQCTISGAPGVNATAEQRQSVLKYIEIMGDLLVDKFDGERYICYDWRVRQARGSSPATAPRLFSLPEDVDARSVSSDVARQVHADASPNGIKQSLTYVLTEAEQDDLLHDRIRARVINLWRPLVPIVRNEVLALCDRTTVEPSDWITLDKVHTRWIEESMYMKHTDAHKWYYVSNQSKDEVTAMVIWDSLLANDRNASVPHSAVQIPNSPTSEKPRESIEVRYILIGKKPEASTL